MYFDNWMSPVLEAPENNCKSGELRWNSDLSGGNTFLIQTYDGSDSTVL